MEDSFKSNVKSLKEHKVVDAFLKIFINSFFPFQFFINFLYIRLTRNVLLRHSSYSSDSPIYQ